MELAQPSKNIEEASTEGETRFVQGDRVAAELLSSLTEPLDFRPIEVAPCSRSCSERPPEFACHCLARCLVRVKLQDELVELTLA